MPLTYVENNTSVFGHRYSSAIDKENSLTGGKAYTQIKFYLRSRFRKAN